MLWPLELLSEIPSVHIHTPTAGPRPIQRMLQGAQVDIFGHMWLVGKILE
jgi:hypothetical protein